MPRAVQLYDYGGIDQLKIVEKPQLELQASEVLVRTLAAGTNPGEIAVREGLFKDRFPIDFPFGQGADFAGRVDAIGAAVSGFAVGDEVLGWSDQRNAQAEYVAVPSLQLIQKPHRSTGTARPVCAVSGSRPLQPWTRFLSVRATSSQSVVRPAGLDRLPCNFPFAQARE